MREFTEQELAAMVFTIQKRLRGKFGTERTHDFVSQDREIAFAFVKETFLVVREALHAANS